MPADESMPRRERSQTFRADVRHRALLRGSESSERFEIGEGGVIGRGAGVGPVPARSSPRLAAARQPGRGRPAGRDRRPGQLERHVCQRPAAHAPTTLVPGDRIDIGPFSLQFDGPGSSAGRGRTTSSSPPAGCSEWSRTGRRASR